MRIADEDSFLDSLKQPSIRFLYVFFISLLLPIIVNLLSGQNASGSNYFDISYGYFIFYSIIVLMCYLCVYLLVFKGYSIFKYVLFLLFFIELIAQIQFISYGLSLQNYLLMGFSSILNFTASLLGITSLFLKIYCIYILFAHKVYSWKPSKN